MIIRNEKCSPSLEDKLPSLLILCNNPGPLFQLHAITPSLCSALYNKKHCASTVLHCFSRLGPDYLIPGLCLDICLSVSVFLFIQPPCQSVPPQSHARHFNFSKQKILDSPSYPPISIPQSQPQLCSSTPSGASPSSLPQLPEGSTDVLLQLSSITLIQLTQPLTPTIILLPESSPVVQAQEQAIFTVLAILSSNSPVLSQSMKQTMGGSLSIFSTSIPQELQRISWQASLTSSKPHSKHGNQVGDLYFPSCPPIAVHQLHPQPCNRPVHFL